MNNENHQFVQLKLINLQTIENLLFGNLDQEDKEVAVDYQKELTTYKELYVGSDEDTTKAHSSLTSYMLQWVTVLENDKSLTTAIASSPLDNRNAIEHELSGIRILFQRPRRYLSYNEQKRMEKGVLPDRKGGKLDSKSPGGIEILIQKRARDEDDLFELELKARRYAVDEDTVIKENSERTITRRMNEAVRMWRKIREELHS